MAALPLPVRGRRGALRAHEPDEPERKRACKLLETVPDEAGARLIDCAMELDSKQKISADSGPWAAKTKQNSAILENHGSRGAAQPCPRCIAGESITLNGPSDAQTCVVHKPFEEKKGDVCTAVNGTGHFSHIVGF